MWGVYGVCVECGVWCGVGCVRGVCEVLGVFVCGVEDVCVCVWCLLLELLCGVRSVCVVSPTNSVSECFEECSPESLWAFPPLLALFSTVLTFSIFCTVLLIFLSVPLSSTAGDCLNI